jgi:hypothetical protein
MGREEAAAVLDLLAEDGRGGFPFDQVDRAVDEVVKFREESIIAVWRQSFYCEIDI